MTELDVLPDIIKKNLTILFIGTSPGIRSATIGHYFAGRSNVFWKLLHQSGLTPLLLRTEQDHKIVHYGYGLTDIVKKPSRTVSDIKQKYTINSAKRVNRLLNNFSPKIAAFVGKKGFRIFTQDNYSTLKYGFQYRYRNTRIFLLPSTSGQSYADTSLDEKLEWYKALRRYAKSIK
jgi:mismatch-specific thymine-DNA glycosylase